jgi:HAD superfamily hydrolase (TIGR01509 family)
MIGFGSDPSAQPPGLRGVIFDMDGVLVDSHATHRRAWRLFLDSLGRHHLDSDLDFILDGHKRDDILRHFFGDIPDRQLEEFGKQKDSIFQQIQLTVSAVPGAVRLVRDLHTRGACLAVATSASRCRAQFTLAQLGLLSHFQALVTGDDVLRGKPDPAIYRLACDRMQIEAKYLVAVEDAVSGVRAAVASGLACIGIALHQPPERLLAAGALHVVSDFTTLNSDDIENILLSRGRDGDRSAISSIKC